MKIILAAVNAKYIHSNLAVYSLRAFAKAYVSETKILEYTINQQMDEILMDLYREKPDLLCFSCYIWNLDYVEELAREIKKILPETILCRGRVDPSSTSDRSDEGGGRGDLSGTSGILPWQTGNIGGDCWNYVSYREWRDPGKRMAGRYGSKSGTVCI